MDVFCFKIIAWLGIRNDYRTLIEVDNLDIVEKDDEEDGDV